jgi:hypothetical protein
MATYKTCTLTNFKIVNELTTDTQKYNTKVLENFNCSSFRLKRNFETSSNQQSGSNSTACSNTSSTRTSSKFSLKKSFDTVISSSQRVSKQRSQTPSISTDERESEDENPLVVNEASFDTKTFYPEMV